MRIHDVKDSTTQGFDPLVLHSFILIQLTEDQIPFQEGLPRLE